MADSSSELSDQTEPVASGSGAMLFSSRTSDLFDATASWLHKVIDPLSRYMCYVGAALSLLMAIGIIVDLGSRFLFNQPLIGMIELETFMLVVMGFFSLAYTMIKDGHVSVDLLTTSFSPRIKSFLGSIWSIWGMYLFALMSWQSILRAIEAYNRNEIVEITTTPLSPFYLVAAFGCFVIALVLLANLFTYLSFLQKSFQKQGIWLILTVAIISLAVIFLPALLQMFSVELGKTTVGILIMGLLLLIMILGFPVAFAMGFAGFLGLQYMMGSELSLTIIRLNTYDSVAEYFFCVVPFFILMGFLCLESGVGSRLYRAGSKWFGQMPGGLAIGTIFGCAGFAAICGDSMATAATMGSVSLPEMKKYDYDDALAAGSLAAGGTLGILIPPSIGFIVYAIVTEQAIGKLFIAGLLPGIILTVLFGVIIFLQCYLKPSIGPKAPKSSFPEKVAAIKDIWQIVILFVVVIGGIYMGIITPTEAGGVGVIGALIIALFSGEFSWHGFFRALLTSTQMTAMIFTILIGVSVLGYFVTLTDIPMQFANYIAGLAVSRYIIFVLILILYLFLGMMMNIIPMMMLTLPILFPTILALGFDPIWFGVIMVIMMEMGQITPPIGINVFVIHGVAENVSMARIFKGILPFILVELLVIVLLTIFPDIALVLPNAMDVLAPIDY